MTFLYGCFIQIYCANKLSIRPLSFPKSRKLDAFEEKLCNVTALHFSFHQHFALKADQNSDPLITVYPGYTFDDINADISF